MTDRPLLWMRHESRPGEGRAPISPADARTLVEHGFDVVVEQSHARCFPIEAYVEAGARTAPGGTWADAPEGAIVIGLKELPEADTPLRDHIYFGHAYKGQDGAQGLLRRFAAGGGTLLDLEYLVGDDGRRVAAFGYWAGYVGAALAVLAFRDELPRPLVPTDRATLDAALAAGAGAGPDTRALVIGALGRSGTGACDAFAAAGIEPTRWDAAETATLDMDALLAHDILVNTVMVDRPVPPFLTDADLDRAGRRLTMISDVTCDVTSDLNVLPVYDAVTTWERPVTSLRSGAGAVSLIAIDNLPTMLPAEASASYSAQLLPVLLTLPDGPVWARARETFARHAAGGA
ncbi:saccharopine dehydrogenase [Agilicoccus flavus]|uniref:saccharopine dehydrogenase n=1 Tax=Agilicoccus flavus TaxID=2775968 RepID=UPI001CF640B7|nr:saccharopine dehydrogenase [Agilicoccus flavus]